MLSAERKPVIPLRLTLHKRHVGHRSGQAHRSQSGGSIGGAALGPTRCVTPTRFVSPGWEDSRDSTDAETVLLGRPTVMDISRSPSSDPSALSARSSSSAEFSMSTLFCLDASTLAQVISGWLASGTQSSSSALAALPTPMHIFRGTTTVPLPVFLEALGRLFQYLKLDAVMLHLSVTYLYRLRRGGFPLATDTVFRLLIAVALLTIKFFDDTSITNRTYACLVDLQPADINALESAALSALQWRLHLEPEELSGLALEALPFRGRF